MYVLAVLLFLAAAAFAEEDSGWIIGGTDVTAEGKYPHQGSLQLLGSHSCGCSLISETWVLTAAHCTEYPAGWYSVYFGMNELSEKSDIHEVAEIIQHENWGSTTGQFPNDIALIRLRRPVEFSHTVQPIKLAPKGSTYVQRYCVITGWGYYKNEERFVIPNVLQEANTMVISKADCGNLWGTSYIVDGHICLYTEAEETGACMGDSGGPLLCPDDDDEMVLAGATSWGSSRCYTNLPSVYTDVAYFRDWIQAKTGI